MRGGLREREREAVGCAGAVLGRPWAVVGRCWGRGGGGVAPVVSVREIERLREREREAMVGRWWGDVRERERVISEREGGIFRSLG